MEKTEYQACIIDALDKVVSKVEIIALETPKNDLDFISLKSNIHELYELIEKYQGFCFGKKSDISSVKTALEVLKNKMVEPTEKTLEKEPEFKALTDTDVLLKNIDEEADEEADARQEFVVEELVVEGVAEKDQAILPDADADIASKAEAEPVECVVGKLIEDEEAEAVFVKGAMGGAVDDAKEEAVGDVVENAVNGSIDDATVDTVVDAVDNAKEDAVKVSIDDAMEDTVMAKEEFLEYEAIEKHTTEELFVGELFVEEPLAESPLAEYVSVEDIEFKEETTLFTENEVEANNDILDEHTVNSEGNFDIEKEEQAKESSESGLHAVFENLHKKALDQFEVREEERPHSYITEFTAMAQSGSGKKQDMSGVAVSSTAMPTDAKNLNNSSDKKENLLDSLRNTKANLHGGHLRTVVDKFRSTQTLNDIRNNTPADLKTAIGLNEKFLLTNDLFNGNTKEFTAAINKLNDAENVSSALVIWNNLKDTFSWNEESLGYLTFYDLLKKRFPELM